MLEYRKQGDGTWARFGKEFADHDLVSISVGNGDPRDSGLRSVLVTNSVVRGSDKVRHSGLEGEYAYAQAVALVEKMIQDNSVGRHNVVLIETSDSRAISDAFDLAQRDVIARHAHASAPVAPEFHKYFIDIYPGKPDRPIISRVGSLELVRLIKERLARQFSGRICDPGGNVVEEWSA